MMVNSQEEIFVVLRESDQASDESDETLVESQSGDVVVRKGRAMRPDGTIHLRVVKPGWGTSGYYPAEVLERDGPNIYPAGTQMFWDHATASEESERPEGSLRNLAAVLSTPARWNDQGAVGPGLYADALVFEGYRETVDEIGPYMGTSIRGMGRATTGEAEGRKGRIISALTHGHSIDFVTKAGAGGEIVQLFEAASHPHPASPTVGEGQMDGRGEPPTDNTALSVGESSDKSSGTSSSGGIGMNELEKARAELAEANRKLTATQGQVVGLETERDRLSEALLMRDAQGVVAEALGEATLPVVTVQRLQRSVSSNPPVTEAGKLDTAGLKERVAEAVTAETAYLQEAAGWTQGRIEGMGGGQAAASDVDMAEVEKRMSSAFADLGFAVASKGK